MRLPAFTFKLHLHQGGGDGGSGGGSDKGQLTSTVNINVNSSPSAAPHSLGALARRHKRNSVTHLEAALNQLRRMFAWTKLILIRRARRKILTGGACGARRTSSGDAHLGGALPYSGSPST